MAKWRCRRSSNRRQRTRPRRAAGRERPKAASLPWRSAPRREIEQDRSRLHEMESIVAVDDGRDLVVGRDLEKVGLELFAFGDVDWVSPIGQPDLLEHD